MSDGDDIRPLLGSYTLGGLDPDEARRVEAHLRTCADCRAVHAELAGLPALMDLVTDPERAPERPGRATERAVLQSFRAQHRSRRRPARRWVLGEPRPRWPRRPGSPPCSCSVAPAPKRPTCSARR